MPAKEYGGQMINDSQPKPVTGLRLKGVKKVVTIRVQHPKDPDKTLLISEKEYENNPKKWKLAKKGVRVEKAAEEATEVNEELASEESEEDLEEELEKGKE